MRLAQQFALENEHVTADCVEATQFPDLAATYGVRAVPKTVVNKTESIEGALPEAMFLENVLKLAGVHPGTGT